jgi:hypothetical protein
MTRYAPTGYTTTPPWVVTCDIGRLLNFVNTVFDGEELGRVTLEDADNLASALATSIEFDVPETERVSR